MEIEAARKVAGVIIYADGGCLHCITALTWDLERTFPEHNWFALVAEALEHDYSEEELRTYNQ